MLKQKSCLILRLSSLGDLILASSVLEVQSLPVCVDWAVAQDYSSLLRHHPRIRQLFEYDRSTGLSGWVQFCERIWNQGYDDVYDLHRSLRTRLMRVLFFWFWFRAFFKRGRLGALREPRVGPRWRTVSKTRGRLWGLFVFKKFWPRAFYPEPWVSRFVRAVGGSGQEKPNLKHLLSVSAPKLNVEQCGLPARWVAVMPGSRWDGKKWPVLYYADLLQKLELFPVILGTQQDLASTQLCNELLARGLPFYSGVGKWDLVATAQILSQAPSGYLGGDTGLAHLAEAVGVSAQVIFGPTTPEMGFGPWRSGSRALGLDLGCRPCGKDGRFCYRLIARHQCLGGLRPDEVFRQLKEGRE